MLDALVGRLGGGTSSRPTSTEAILFVAAVMAVIAVQQLTTAKDAGTRFFVLCATAVGGYTVWSRLDARALGSATTQRRLDEVTAHATRQVGGTWKRSLDADLYTLRNLAPTSARPLEHLELRPAVVRALLSLRPHLKRNRGAYWRLLCLLEDFYARFDRVLLAGDARLATRSHGTFMDTRAEALAVLQTVRMAVSVSDAPRVDGVTSVVRHDTQRCLAILANKYRRAGGTTASTHVDWRGPHPHDARRDARYHVHI